MQRHVDSYEIRKYEDWSFELSDPLLSMGNSSAEHDMPKELIDKAKEDELTSMTNMQVFDIIPRAEAEQEANVVWVDCRWVITNKGSAADPVAKARLVAREYADCKRNDLYAGTLSLGFIKM